MLHAIRPTVTMNQIKGASELDAMNAPQAEAPRTELDFQIDPRSFHAFEFQGDTLLFDRSTGGTFSVDDSAFRVLSLVEAGYDIRSACAVQKRFTPELDENVLIDTLRSLWRSGLFRFAPVDYRQQEALIDELWRHKPRRIQMLMAQGCNLGCRYCYAWRNGSNQLETLMPWEVAKQSIDYLVKRSEERRELQITFFGGEPLLNLPIIRRTVEYCRQLEEVSEKRFVFELITNGTLLSREVASWLVAERFQLMVSLDGEKDMHNFNRPAMDGSDLYEVILDNAKHVNEAYARAGLPAPKIRANLTTKYLEQYKTGRFLASQGFTVIGVGAIEPLPHGDSSPSSLTETQMDQLHEEAMTGMLESLRTVIRGQALDLFARRQLKKWMSVPTPQALKGITCGIGRNTQVIDNKGNIYPCHRYEGMRAYIIGDVFNGLDYQKTVAYYRKVNQNATNRCHSCWIRDYCAGGCAWLLSKKDGHLADPTERECDRRRTSMERALWLRQKVRAHFPNRFKNGDEIDLDSWDWGAANECNEAHDELVTQAVTTELNGSCGSGTCGNCGSGGRAD